VLWSNELRKALGPGTHAALKSNASAAVDPTDRATHTVAQTDGYQHRVDVRLGGGYHTFLSVRMVTRGPGAQVSRCFLGRTGCS